MIFYSKTVDSVFFKKRKKKEKKQIVHFHGDWFAKINKHKKINMPQKKKKTYTKNT